MIPSTIERVQESTSAAVNGDIRRETRQNLANVVAEGGIAINRRLE